MEVFLDYFPKSIIVFPMRDFGNVRKPLDEALEIDGRISLLFAFGIEEVNRMYIGICNNLSISEHSFKILNLHQTIVLTIRKGAIIGENIKQLLFRLIVAVQRFTHRV